MPAVCVLGGGYAGLRVVRSLPGRLDADWSITLVDRGECHQLITRLPEVVAGKIGGEDAYIPFNQVLHRRVTHRRAEVESVDLRTRRVQTSSGPLQADLLVIAAGTSPDFSGVPGAAVHAMTLKSVQDAVLIRDKLGTLQAVQPTVRVVIVGAGYTATELAGELTASNRRAAAGEIRGRVEVCIASEDAHLLPQADPRLSSAVERVLRARRVPLNLRQVIRRIDAGGVETERGDYFRADLVVWAGPTYVSFQMLGVTGGAPAGKLRTDPYLQVGTDSHTFACGDAAFIFDYTRGVVAPSSAQLAVQEGDVVARNVSARIRGTALEEYRPRILGEALGLGGTDGVALVGGVIVSGRPAIAIKRAALLRYLSGLSMPFHA